MGEEAKLGEIIISSTAFQIKNCPTGRGEDGIFWNKCFGRRQREGEAGQKRAAFAIFVGGAKKILKPGRPQTAELKFWGAAARGLFRKKIQKSPEVLYNQKSFPALFTF